MDLLRAKRCQCSTRVDLDTFYQRIENFHVERLKREMELTALEDGIPEEAIENAVFYKTWLDFDATPCHPLRAVYVGLRYDILYVP